VALSSATFRCTVVTPERATLDCEASFVALPAWDGEIGILRNRAPLLCRLGIGLLRVESPAGDQVLLIDGGFAEMADNRLTILTSSAKRSEELDPADIEAGLEVARKVVVRDEASYKTRQDAVQRVRAQKKLMHLSS